MPIRGGNTQQALLGGFGQRCLRGEVSHSMRLYRGLRGEGHHPEGEESKNTRVGEVAYMFK